MAWWRRKTRGSLQERYPLNREYGLSGQRGTSPLAFYYSRCIWGSWNDGCKCASQLGIAEERVASELTATADALRGLAFELDELERKLIAGSAGELTEPLWRPSLIGNGHPEWSEFFDVRSSAGVSDPRQWVAEGGGEMLALPASSHQQAIAWVGEHCSGSQAQTMEMLLVRRWQLVEELDRRYSQFVGQVFELEEAARVQRLSESLTAVDSSGLRPSTAGAELDRRLAESGETISALRASVETVYRELSSRPELQGLAAGTGAEPSLGPSAELSEL